MRKLKLIKFTAILFCTWLISTGCVKPVNKPKFVTVDTTETAFVVPLEDASSKQKKLDSAETLRKLQVSTKRIQVPKRWQKTGRWEWQGEWIDLVRVIKVNRAPVTEEWSADENTGTSSKNEAIWSESSDSVGYSVGFNCTAEIQEKDAALFLYNYPNGSLAKIMNAQVRTRVQQIVSEVSTQYNMDILRTKKAEIISAVREDVIPFFGETGITITTLGLYGQFQYENPKIQASIDDVFVAQQEKAEEKAKLQAMADKQERMKQQGIAEANQAREIAQGEADAKVLVMKAEADGIRMVNQALQEAQSNPLFIKVKTLEVESERIKKWKGDVPRMQFGGDTGAIPLINISGME